MATINLRYIIKMKETFITKRGREEEKEENSIATQKQTENNQTSPSSHGRLVVWKKTIIGKIRTGDIEEYPQIKKRNMAKKWTVPHTQNIWLACKAHHKHLQNVQNKCSAIIVMRIRFSHKTAKHGRQCPCTKLQSIHRSIQVELKVHCISSTPHPSPKYTLKKYFSFEKTKAKAKKKMLYGERKFLHFVWSPLAMHGMQTSHVTNAIKHDRSEKFVLTKHVGSHHVKQQRREKGDINVQQTRHLHLAKENAASIHRCGLHII